MYLSYPEYCGMGGTLGNAVFLTYLEEAEAIIDSRTYDRLRSEKTIDGRVKRCLFALIGIIQKKHDVQTGDAAVIASESNDGVSVTYGGMSVGEQLERCDTEVTACIRTYLAHVRASDGTPLLFCGVVS